MAKYSFRLSPTIYSCVTLLACTVIFLSFCMLCISSIMSNSLHVPFLTEAPPLGNLNNPVNPIWPWIQYTSGALLGVTLCSTLLCCCYSNSNDDNTHFDNIHHGQPVVNLNTHNNSHMENNHRLSSEAPPTPALIDSPTEAEHFFELPNSNIPSVTMSTERRAFSIRLDGIPPLEQSTTSVPTQLAVSHLPVAAPMLVPTKTRSHPLSVIAEEASVLMSSLSPLMPSLSPKMPSKMI